MARTRTELALELAKSVRTYLNQFNFKINITRNVKYAVVANFEFSLIRFLTDSPRLI